MRKCVRQLPMNLGLEHTYASLPERLFAQVQPTPVANPTLVIFNDSLAASLGLASLRTQAAQVLSGNALPDDARPIAMAYAGHQFAHFVPQLGDGRAILLGEKRTTDGKLYDVQLKGAGRTPFSRAGDGRAALGPMLREYLISEAMHALGIPTTRSLAVVATGEQVMRETPLPGAILTRVAASHLRVGTFEYFSARQDVDALRALLDYAIRRHEPDLVEAQNPPLAFLQRACDRQASLMAQWLSVGFIHGVMNTDNMALAGETIDYGPCAFMDEYHPQTVFSSIDSRGRYAYGNQPSIAQWNLGRFADALLPLIDPDQTSAIERASAVVSAFMETFDVQFRSRMCAKLGLASVRDEDTDLINTLLALMRASKVDFTLAFRDLTQAVQGIEHDEPLRALFQDQSVLADWLIRWRARLRLDSRSVEERYQAMRRVNPRFIPRNHRVEAALNAATDHGDLGLFMDLLTVLTRPFDDHPMHADLMRRPRDDERVHATFCGT
jgi:serine/tyrosine/threonine adenylyltransferase